MINSGYLTGTGLPHNATRIAGGIIAAACLVAIAPISAEPVEPPADWPVYGGNAEGQRYSPLRQITSANVSSLREAWRVETGPGGLQTSPIVVDGIVYACRPDQSVMALDGATGRQLWHFAAPVRSFQPARGVSMWRNGNERRLFVTNSHYLYALDPATGQPISGFGNGGRIDLREGLGRDPATLAVFLTTPGIVWHDLIITGFRTGEGMPAAPGAVRAYSVRSGKPIWTFRTIPAPGEPGSETWPTDAALTAGGANNWAGMALDEKRGIVFVPTGSAVPDFYGAARHGSNLYANSLVALDAASGHRLWHFQIVHHDLWDRDLGTPPTLLTVTRDGRRVDAVAQAGKNGLLFVFDRVTGKPVFPIEDRSVPASTVPGERSAPTQPVPLAPLPLARQWLTEGMLTQRTPAAHAAVLDQFRSLHSGGLYEPLAADRKTMIFPGTDGGASWGGGAADPTRGIYYINVQDVPWLGGLRANSPAGASPARMIYDQQCASCHGADLQGHLPEFPALLDVSKRLTRAQVSEVLLAGRGRMPAFPQLTSVERDAIQDLLFAPAAIDSASASASLPPEMLAEYRAMAGSRREAFLYTGYEKFRDPDGYSAAKPPWGTLNAVDLNAGRILWQVPLGEYPELASAGVPTTGTENYGGPLLTASHLLFIGATIYDRKFRAFDARNGQVRWETVLPYAGTATPVSYAVKGRQYVLIAASGARDPKGPQGSAYIAFALSGSR